MSLTASLMTTHRVQQCCNIHVTIDIWELFLFLFHCCILLGIKPTTTTTVAAAAATATTNTINMEWISNFTQILLDMWLLIHDGI